MQRKIKINQSTRGWFIILNQKDKGRFSSGESYSGDSVPKIN